jgi:hypothetical protein
MVKNVLDPQLMAALKEIGFHDKDLYIGMDLSMEVAGPPILNNSNPQHSPQEGKFSTNMPPNSSSLNAHQGSSLNISGNSRPREGKGTSSSNTTKGEKNANTGGHAAHLTGRRCSASSTVLPCKPEESSRVQKGTQMVNLGAVEERNGSEFYVNTAN